MSPLHRRLALVFSLLVLLVLAPWPARAHPAIAVQATPPYLLYVPTNAASHQPLQVVVAVHGMGGDGPSFAAPLLAEAEQKGLVLVAPTFAYGDWRDPNQVVRDDATNIPQLKTLLDGLPARTGLQLQPRVLMYGFSRGGQTVHRFAEFYPRSVLGVASFSCGTFTLPYRAMPTDPDRVLPFPYGVGDIERYTGRPFDVDALRQVSFLIGVGAADDQAADVPRQWDPYLGDDRVARAESYHEALQSLGVRADLQIFPDSVHAETDEMRQQAMAYLTSLPH